MATQYFLPAYYITEFGEWVQVFVPVEGMSFPMTPAIKPSDEWKNYDQHIFVDGLNYLSGIKLNATSKKEHFLHEKDMELVMKSGKKSLDERFCKNSLIHIVIKSFGGKLWDIFQSKLKKIFLDLNHKADRECPAYIINITTDAGESDDSLLLRLAMWYKKLGSKVFVVSNDKYRTAACDLDSIISYIEYDGMSEVRRQHPATSISEYDRYIGKLIYINFRSMCRTKSCKIRITISFNTV